MKKRENGWSNVVFLFLNFDWKLSTMYVQLFRASLKLNEILRGKWLFAAKACNNAFNHLTLIMTSLKSFQIASYASQTLISAYNRLRVNASYFGSKIAIQQRETKSLVTQQQRCEWEVHSNHVYFTFCSVIILNIFEIHIVQSNKNWIC